MNEIQLDTSPYQRFLGLECIESGDGQVTIRLPFRKELLRQEGSDWIHGGVISALADIAGDYAIVTRTGPGVPTIDLRIDWLRPARAGDLTARARAVKVGRTISVADIEIEDQTGKLVAVARGCYATPQQASPFQDRKIETDTEKSGVSGPEALSAPSTVPPADRLNDIGVLKRREIEARMIAPFVTALSRHFDRKQVLAILQEVVVDVARSQGADLAGQMGGCSPAHLAESLDAWTKDDALELEVLNQSKKTLFFNVTRCRYAELYQALGIPELGEILSCGRDPALIEGFNPELELDRSQTILGGAPHCDFRYRQREGPDSEVGRGESEA